MAGVADVTLGWEERYYAVAIRVAAAIAIAALLAIFLALPRSMEVKPYELRKSVEMIMEALVQ